MTFEKSIEKKSSDLDKWLRKRNIRTKDFRIKVGCSTFVIWKVKHGLKIRPKYADIIAELTNNEVIPIV